MIEFYAMYIYIYVHCHPDLCKDLINVFSAKLFHINTVKKKFFFFLNKFN